MCCDCGVEPALQPLDHEPLRHVTANREDGACLDGADRGGIGSVHSLTLGCLILLHVPILIYHSFVKYTNRRKDEYMMKEFFPLWYSAATGGMEPSTTTVFRKLASMLADYLKVNYESLFVLAQI